MKSKWCQNLQVFDQKGANTTIVEPLSFSLVLLTSVAKFKVEIGISLQGNQSLIDMSLLG